MPERGSLVEYQRKRDFRRSPEPKGGRGRRRKQPRFVVQKHAASSLHYDFRLETAGVLKSWAVPKGPSLDPREKRLAMPPEDHALEYADCEGVIPEGEYGAGSVIVWDAGTYRNLAEEPVEQGIDDGHLKVWLEGEKLSGGYALTRMGGGSASAGYWSSSPTRGPTGGATRSARSRSRYRKKTSPRSREPCSSPRVLRACTSVNRAARGQT